jgi:predicted Ser/Thr protein kinase
VTGDGGARAAPLRSDDPVRLGAYQLVGRLGEGGMGTVYLARDPSGRPVAVKVVRADLAADPEFLLRFRSEVDQARQVPPFCTAEVLDADLDDRHPYLVVEYVDGPSLAEVVEERGPLSPANLHALAIGVATALTAIHGAGVVHRDLKPRNVLLAPGSPKVIDFGIARAMEATSQLTRTNQMLGTVAYMAPERFDVDARTPLGAPSDVFAWGAVVAYAGTGRTPFHGDSAPATAARILTQPPDLTDLPPQLSGLVLMALAKEPGDRPTARELLDLLLGSGPNRATVQAALAGQPELTDAARLAMVGDQLTAPGRWAAPEPATPIAGAPEAGARLGAPPGRRGSRVKVFAAAAVAVAVVAGATPYLLDRFAGKAPASTSIGPPAIRAASSAPVKASASAPDESAAPTPSGTPSPRAVLVVFRDDLRQAGKFKPLRIAQGSCEFRDDGYLVELTAEGSLRCPGPPDLIVGDRTISVDVVLQTPGTCAAIWFVSSPVEGYALNVCEESVILDLTRQSGTERVGARSLAKPITLGKPVRMSTRIDGSSLTVLRDGEAVAVIPLDADDLLSRRTDMTLGVLGDDPAGDPPYRASFGKIKVSTPS